MTITNLPKIPKKEKTFLEILGVHNREVPIANLLKYLFDPKENHGLKDIFINSLLETECYHLVSNNSGVLKENGFSIKNGLISKESDKGHFNFKKTETAAVFVEVPTEKQKRIDIVIIDEVQKFIIVIEFKINHLLNNPLDIYKNHFEKEKIIINRKNYKEHYENYTLFFVVLTPSRKKLEKTQDNQNSFEHFKQITLTHLVEKIKEQNNIEELREQNKNNPKFLYFNEFIKTIENRTHEKKFREAVSAQKDKINKMNLEDSSEWENSKEWKNILNYLKEQIDSKILKLKKQLNKGTINKNGFLEIKKETVTLKIRLTIENGWSIETWENSVKTNTKPETYSFDTSIGVIAEIVSNEICEK